MALFAEIPSEDATRRFDIKSPVTLESIGQFRAAGPDEVKAAVEAGLLVLRVEPERDDLEHIFLEVTKGELQ